jgi:FAD binding domain/Berberine and berberine like
MTHIHSTAGATVFSDEVVLGFKSRMRGPLLRPGDDGYDTARTIWNGMIDRRPGLIARCLDAGDVIAAVTVAREHRLLVSIRGGGHNITGNAVCDGGLMIDLSPMRRIDIDAGARTVRAEAGVIWRELDQATQAFGLATTGGVVAETGIAGFTLGGGFGYLMRRFGLACDNLISVEIVTADGQLRTASAMEHPDLFWGVRGGGGNFGVVTTLTYRLHPVGPTILGGMVIHPFNRARDMFQFYREFTVEQPDELTVYAGLMTAQDGTRAGGMVVCYTGPLEEGERLLAPLRRFGPPAADLIAPTPYTAQQELYTPLYPKGRLNYWKSSFVDELSDPAIETMIAQFDAVPSPLSSAGLEHLGGALSRVGWDTSAFSQRDARYNLLITGEWTDPAENEVNIGWTRGFWQAMQPFTRDSVYINYLGGDEHDRARSAYGSKYDRLVALKTKYDPTNLFRMNHNIEPAQ